MDLNKKIALIRWLDALSDRKVENFNDLRDLSVITDALSKCGCILPGDYGLNREERLTCLKKYMEGFYHQTFDDKTLIDYEVLGSDIRGDTYELEMGKVLLALLGCVVQDDKTREKFVEPALTLDERSQCELKEMIEHVLFMNEYDTKIQPGFAEVLKRRTDNGMIQSPYRLSTCSPNHTSRSSHAPVNSLFTNSPGASPGHNTSINIRDISSPLRVMTLASPISPLSALMHSPQLAQKAILRQREKIKKLELALQVEKHLREDLELDLSQRSDIITQRECRIHELEKQLGESRHIRDRIDELDCLQVERDGLSSRITELQNRLMEQKDIREQNQSLEREIHTLTKELTDAREEISLMASMKKTIEEYHVKSHKQQLRLKEVEASLDRQNNIVFNLRQELEESNNLKQVYQDQCNSLKQEKKQLEESYCFNHGNVMQEDTPVNLGESMNVVIEKRLSELQTEYDQIRTKWIQPHVHESLKLQLSHEQEEKKTYEERYFDTRKELQNFEEEINRLKSNINQYQTRVESLQESLSTTEEHCQSLESDLNTVREEKQKLMRSEQELLQIKNSNESTITELEKKHSALKTELRLTQEEVELHKSTSERRQSTISKLDEEKIKAQSTEEKLLSDIKTLKKELIGLQDQLRTTKEDYAREELSLKEKITSLEKVNDELSYDKQQQNDELKALRQKVSALKVDLKEVNRNLDEEKDSHARKVEKLENEIREERVRLEEAESSLRNLNTDYNKYTLDVKGKMNNLEAQVSSLTKEKRTVDLELQSVKFELENTKTSYHGECQKLDTMFADRENRLKQEIVSLNYEIEKLEKGKQDLNTELLCVREMSNGQKAEIGELNSLVERLKSTITDLNSEIDQSQDSIVRLEHEVKRLNTKLQFETDQNERNMKKFHEDTEFMNTQHKAEVAKLKLYNEHQLKELTDKHAAADKLFQEKIGEWMKSMETIKESHSDEVKALKKMIEEKEAKYLIQSADYKDLGKSFWSALNSIEVDYLTMKNMANEKRLLKEELEKVCADRDGEIVTLKDKIAELCEKITNDSVEAENTVKALTEEKSEVLNQLSEFKLESENCITELKKELTQLQSEICERIEMYEGIVQEKSTLQEQYNQMVNESGSKITEMENELKTLQSEIEERNEMFQKTVEEKAQLQEQFTEMTRANEGKIADTESVVAKLDAELNELRNVSQTLEEEKTIIENQYTQLREESEIKISEAQNMISGLRSELEKERTDAQELQQQKVAMETQLTILKSDSDSKTVEMSSRVSELQCELEDKVNTVQQLSNEKSAMEEKVSQLSSEMMSQVEKYESMVGDLKKNIEQYETDVNELCSEKSAVQAEYEEFRKESETKMAELQTHVAKLQVELDTERSNVSQLQNEKSTIQHKFEQFRLNAESMNTDSESKVSQLESKLSEMESELNKLTNEKSEIETRFTQHLQECENNITVKDTTVAKLQSELDEQRINYQQLMCGMEEKLGGEVTDLRERLSQMKCQYDTLIKSKEDDIKQITKEKESLTLQFTSAEQQMSTISNEKAEIVKQLESVINEKVGVEKELESVVAKSSALEQELNSCREELSEFQKNLQTSQQECDHVKEELRHEKAERDDLKRQLEYTQERTDTLTAELSSYKQQLAAVEEEKLQTESQLGQLDVQQTQIREQLDSEKQKLEFEKEELERQLQSSQKCFEAVKKTQEELQQSLEKSQTECSRLEERRRESEQRLGSFMEKERSLLEKLQRLRDTNELLNQNLESRMKDISSAQSCNSNLQHEIETMRQFNREQENRFRQDLQTLREEKTVLEIRNAELSKIESTSRMTEAEKNKLQEINDNYKVHYNKKKEIIAEQNEKIAKLSKEIDYYKRMEDKLTSEHTAMQDKLNLEIVKNKNLAKKMSKLETENDYADRKLREYKQQLDRGSAFLGDPSDFQKMIMSRENASDASFMENHPSSVPMDDSFAASESEKTLTPNTRSRARRSKISKSSSSPTLSGNDNADTCSIGSTTSLAYRLRSRESAVSLNQTINSEYSMKSTTSLPRGAGVQFHCEDEPQMDFEWGRLGELSRRNTMCPSHLKTSYPVETQRYQPNKFREDALRESTINNQTVIPPQPGSGRKRKQGWDSTDSGSDSTDSKSSKQAKTVYRKPGPPTPRNSRRSSKGSKSPSLRRMSSRSTGSPASPLSSHGRHTPKRSAKSGTPKRGANGTPKRGTGVLTRSNQGSGKKEGRRDSVAFNVGFSPLSMGRSSQLKRQQAFIQKQPESSSKSVFRKPLGTRNYLQTGL